MSDLVLSGKQQRMSAQIFNIASIVAVLVPPLILIWIAASIFVYAAIAHHPNPKVVYYLQWAGYRFYGLVGTLVVVLNFSGFIRDWLGSTAHMWLVIWLLSMLVVIPLGIRDIWRASREHWIAFYVQEAKPNA